MIVLINTRYYYPASTPKQLTNLQLRIFLNSAHSKCSYSESSINPNNWASFTVNTPLRWENTALPYALARQSLAGRKGMLGCRVKSGPPRSPPYPPVRFWPSLPVGGKNDWRKSWLKRGHRKFMIWTLIAYPFGEIGPNMQNNDTPNLLQDPPVMLKSYWNTF